MSKIVKSAIRYNDKVYTGFDHAECFKQIDKDTIKDYDKLEQGFITDKNEFVDRQQALDIAYKAGQIPYEKNNHCLISEDIHLYWLNDLQTQLDQQKEMWEKLKEWLDKEYKNQEPTDYEKMMYDEDYFIQSDFQIMIKRVIDKMQELEGEKDEQAGL